MVSQQCSKIFAVKSFFVNRKSFIIQCIFSEGADCCTKVLIFFGVIVKSLQLKIVNNWT